MSLADAVSPAVALSPADAVSRSATLVGTNPTKGPDRSRVPSRPPTGLRLRVVQALVVVALILAGVVGLQAATARPVAAAPAQDVSELVCGSLPVISESCSELLDSAAWAIGQGAGGIGESVVAGAFDYFARWVAVGAIGAIDLVWSGIDGTTTPSISLDSSVFDTSVAAARSLAFPLLILAALYSLLKRDSEIAIKSAFLYLPGSVVGMVVAGYVITALLAATDQLSAAYLDDGQTGVAVWLDNLGSTIAAGVGFTAPILLVIFSFVLIAGSILVWLVMIVRSAAIVITYAFMPLAFAAIIFPATRGWIKRLIEIQLSFILAKPVIVAVLALGSQTLNEVDNSLVAMMQAAALFYLAAFSPFALMKLLPFVGHEAVAAMEQPSGAPNRAFATAVGVVGGQKLAGFLAGSQQAGPAASTVSASTSGGGGDSGGAVGSSGGGISPDSGSGSGGPAAGGGSLGPSESGGAGSGGSPSSGGPSGSSGPDSASGGGLPGGSARPPTSSDNDG
ncbi:MAG: hypothetical protein GY724_06235 [Actinomycetia bacterium]|nr:hypothetical protein [Actinomycetes bacterium]